MHNSSVSSDFIFIKSETIPEKKPRKGAWPSAEFEETTYEPTEEEEEWTEKGIKEQIKLTVSKFYRINGGSTQNLGVIPDISFPSRFSLMDIGESANLRALMWDKIQPLRYDTLSALSHIIPKLKIRSGLRLTKNAEYGKLIKSLDEYKIRADQKFISLQEDKRLQEREQASEPDDTDDSSDSPADNRDQQKLVKDLLLTESTHILGDYILLAQKKN